MSLPARWVKENHLKKGDEIEVEIKGKSIIINGQGKPASREITVKYDSNEAFVRRLFLIPYIRGYNKIKIYFREPEIFDKIQENLHILFGFEIVEQKQDYCILQHIARESEGEFNKIFSRLFNVVGDMLMEILVAIESDNFDELKRISRMESLANRLSFLCRRMIHQDVQDPDYIKHSAYSIILFLEDITDHLKIICDMSSANKKPFPKKTHNIFRNLVSLFTLIRQIYYKEDFITYLNEFKSLRKTAIRQVSEISLEKDKTARLALLYVMCVLADLHNLSEEVIYGR